MSGRIAVVVPNLNDSHRKAIREAAMRNDFTVRFLESPEEDRAFMAEADIIFGHLPEIARESPKLQWICTPFAGIDQFCSPEAFANRDAVLTNSSGAYGVTIAEHVVMLLLRILRRDPEYREIILAKGWRRDLTIRSVYGSRITLLGTGDIGQETAKRLRAFSPASLTGVNRSGNNPGGLFDSVVTTERLNMVLPETDILVVSLPGTNETCHMLNRELLGYLPDHAVVINVGRGSVIDQDALTAELEKGRLFAGLDVFEQEPLPAEDPAWNLPNLVITPHAAGNMALSHTVDRIVEMFLEDLDNYAAHRPLKHTVDRRKGY